MNVVVRRAEVSDADAIGSIHVRAWQYGYRGQMPDDFLDGLSVEDRQASWREGLPELPADRRVLVVEDPVDGHVCGFSTLGVVRFDGTSTPGEGEVWAINLEPEAWGRGIGAPLLHAAADELRRWGRDVAVLWVLDTNARARRFYEREGWTPDGGVKDDEFGGQVVHEVRYRRVLSAAPARD
ncbi:MAG TPA: GNAT family N-acetyltransferase [Acidimicrobiales bacterium]|nr:GNAT family N-acetyltransferase [Acidimicrobiales bacterium]